MTFGIIGNAEKPALHDVLVTLLSQLHANNLEFLLHDGLAKVTQSSDLSLLINEQTMVNEDDLPRRSDMIIALGGDGTMLYAARLVGEEETPILGINLGKLGFLAEVSVNEIAGCIRDIAEGKYVLEDRMTIRATTPVDDCRYVALNEIVIDRGESARVIEVETYVNGDYLVTYAADGLIVTTPTGSTAYSLASGGPIVDPKSQVITINPISPHSLTARPVIVPDDSSIRVVVHSGAKPIHITADGQVERFYETPAEFTIQKASHVVKLVKRKKRTYFDLLRTKLMWGKDFRMESSK